LRELLRLRSKDRRPERIALLTSYFFSVELGKSCGRSIGQKRPFLKITKVIQAAF
jgi:hypothetical protein